MKISFPNWDAFTLNKKIPRGIHVMAEIDPLKCTSSLRYADVHRNSHIHWTNTNQKFHSLQVTPHLHSHIRFHLSKVFLSLFFNGTSSYIYLEPSFSCSSHFFHQSNKILVLQFFTKCHKEKVAVLWMSLVLLQGNSWHDLSVRVLELLSEEVLEG